MFRIASTPKREDQNTIRAFPRRCPGSIAGARGHWVFAPINFALDPKNNGPAMGRTQLLLFGHPKAGPPLMLDAPTTTLDLPLKVLVAQDGEM